MSHLTALAESSLPGLPIRLRRGRSAQRVSRQRMRGFSLIEVLIAAVVFVIGIIGLINLNTRIVGYQRTALVRASVAGVTSSIAEIVRANPGADYTEQFYPAKGENGLTAAACTNNCTADQWAANDRVKLHAIFSSSSPVEGLANGQGGYVIERVSTGTGALPLSTYNVTVFWPEKDIIDAGGSAPTASSGVGARSTCPAWVTSKAGTTPVQCVLTRVQ